MFIPSFKKIRPVEPLLRSDMHVDTVLVKEGRLSKSTVTLC